jgi:hypothetical protein
VPGFSYRRLRRRCINREGSAEWDRVAVAADHNRFACNRLSDVLGSCQRPLLHFGGRCAGEAVLQDHLLGIQTSHHSVLLTLL